MSLTHKAVHAFKWSFLAEIFSRGIGPLVFLILARILLPSDFGVVASATVIISFSQVLADAGLAKALIQRQDKIREAANVVFWINLFLGMILGILLQVGAPFIAAFFNDPRIVNVVRVLAIQVLLAEFSSVHLAIMRREFRFKELFWVRLLTATVPALASIPLALNGLGYWALVSGTIVGQIAQSVVLWLRSQFRPFFKINSSIALELVIFGKWALLSAVLGWLYLWLDAIIVGHYLGSHDMGLYRTGNTFVTMVFGVVFSPLLPVLYSFFSRKQHDLFQLRETFMSVVRSIVLISLPLGIWIFVFRDSLGAVLFGQKWEGVGMVIGFMGLTHGFAWIVGANGEIYRALGKPQVETLAMVGSLAVYVVGYLFSIRYGLDWFLVARCSLVLVGVFSQVLICWYFLKIRPVLWINSLIRPLIISFSVAFLINYLNLNKVHDVKMFIMSFTFSFLFLLIFIFIFEKEFILKTLSSLNFREKIN